ncbi:hypothetical protein HPB47_017349 [Ixodes persulcatus]|uniref:Uncharacterized protein n=1 Tax=Ixodes persulcatus TaxID=34615 RepID=A0AC60QNN2_IXOPE|nr:hypothetical protein HPB47_017349 [Ixodes persulcatus]
METQNNKSPSVGTENPSGINDVSRVQRPSTHSAPTPAAIPDDNNSANPTGDDHQPTEPPTDQNGDDDEASGDREVAFAAIVRRADRETTTPERWLALVIERRTTWTDSQRHKQNEAPSRALKRICKANQYHSNNEDQVKKLEDQIEEKRAVFEKKLMIAANRTEYRRTNKLFEFNRSTFYRRLDEDQNEIDGNIDLDKVITFWRGIWATDDEKGSTRN